MTVPEERIHCSISDEEPQVVTIKCIVPEGLSLINLHT